MYPHERSLVKRLADVPFALVGVNSDTDLAELHPRLEEEKIVWRSFWDGPDGTRGPIATRWNVNSWPTTLVIDAEGVIRYRNVFYDELEHALEGLLAGMGVEIPPAVDEG